MKTTKLSSSVTVEQYQAFKVSKDTTKIANLISERFKERYIEPFENNKAKHGFSMMTIGCLMVEVLHSFKKGWKRSSVKGEDLFEEFFKTSTHLQAFQGMGKCFYENIRCGLLHQAETYDGWKILRAGNLVDRTEKTINASKFLKAITSELDVYVYRLKSEPYNSEIWKKAFRKLDYICNSC